MKLHGTMNIENQQLFIGGVSCQTLVNIYQTPLYVFDEALLRQNCKDYRKHFKVEERGNRVAYAGKAFLPLYMCHLIKEEGLYLDVVSGGELYTAYKADFPMDHVLFHGNNKTFDEINMGLEYGVGVFVVDNYYELETLNTMCHKRGKQQNVYLRITPGIEAHTHDYIKTGQIDSKFGFTLSNGDLQRCLEVFHKYEHLNLIGLHAHIGSQIFDVNPFLDEVEIMMTLVKDIKEQFGFEITDVDLGGGVGVYYTEKDAPKSIAQFCEAILTKAQTVCETLQIDIPRLIIEPGRSIVANAGSTLYTVGSMKDIKDVRTYVSVDGGMTDNIRPSLYQAVYECAIANWMESGNERHVTIAGKCCESGDILITDVDVNKIESGDILIITSTGAYGYSMSSNYNKIPKAAVVAVKDGEAQLICRRQTYEELLSLEV